MKKTILLLIILNLVQHPTFAQNKKLDSLKAVLGTENEDTNKVNTLTALSWTLSHLGNLNESIQYGKDALSLSEKLSFKKGIGNAYKNIGIVYRLQGNYPEALKTFLICFKIREETGDKKGIADCYSKIGMIYMLLGNYSESLKNHFAGLKIRTEINDKEDIANSINNIGNVYSNQANYAEALKYYLTFLKLSEEIGDKQGVAYAYSNIGEVNIVQKNYEEALKNNLASLKIAEELGEKYIIAGNYISIGILNIKLHKFEEAKKYLYDGLSLSKEMGNKDDIKRSYSGLSALDSVQGNFKEAYDDYKFYIIYRDSLINEEATKKTIQTQMNYEFEKKESLSKAESKKQKLIIVFIGLGLLIVLVFAGFIFRSLRIRNKQNKIIVEQKIMVEEKQKEILDSIEYALRIQTAILPPKKIVKQYLENSFILYKPKDIVAGDFYWMETTDDLVLFAACDCTGHGVPGAMVSVVCHNALNRAVKEFGLTQPAAILDKTAEIVIENFSKSEEDIKDGMDISLCAYNAKTKTIQWAGANNPLWLLQNGELIETKADKQPIGMNENSKPFTNHKFTLQKGEIIYLFTDGFADQFGGETGQKKLTKKRFKDLILSIQNITLQEQGIALDKFITEYRKEVEQIDDILVMGVKV